MKRYSNKVLLITTMFILVILVIGYLFYININNNKSILITGVVKYKGNNYIIATDTNNVDYKINNIDNINKGDVVSVNINNINYNKNPIESDVMSIESINKPISFTVVDNNNSSNEKDSSNSSDEKGNSKAVENTKYGEDDLIDYANNLNNKMDNYNDNMSSDIKDKFVSLIDFIFYDKELYGYRFNDLSNGAKLKILSIVIFIDNKIEKNVPGYKEWVSNTGEKLYSNIKEKALSKYMDITVSICNNKEDLCNSAKEGLGDLKDNFSITWDMIKSIVKDNVSKLGNWYEIWRNV